MIENEIEIEKLKYDWITEFDKSDELYKDFYKDNLYYTNIHFIYVNNENNIEKIREEVFYMKRPNYISREEVIGIIKRNSLNNDKKYFIFSILKFIITLEPNDVIKFLKDTMPSSSELFLTSITHIDAITLEPTISMFRDLTDLFFIFHEKQMNTSNKQNMTKKIILHNSNHKKTIRK